MKIVCFVYKTLFVSFSSGGPGADPIEIEAISRERLFHHKVVTKETERCAKELRKLAKRHAKEKEAVQKAQSAATAALISDHTKARALAEKRKRQSLVG